MAAAGSRFIHGHQAARRPILEEAVPFKIDGVYCRLIPLANRGMYTIVDAADYEWIMANAWQAYRYKKTWYAVRRQWVDGAKRTFYLHREILKTSRGMLTDHRSGVGLDNRRANLREATTAENNTNRAGKHVQKRGSRFRSRIKVGGQERFLGSFATEDAAREAYNKAAARHFGEFARPA